MGHHYTTEEILGGFDVAAHADEDATAEALTIFEGFLAAKMFTALAGEGLEGGALTAGYTLDDATPEMLRDAWGDVASFIYVAETGGVDFSQYTDDELDGIGMSLAFSLEGHGTGLWDSEHAALEDFREGMRSEGWTFPA